MWLVSTACFMIISAFPDAFSVGEGAYIAYEPFLWGTATAAYQIEGGAELGGRGPSIWDAFSAVPGKVANNDTGAIAADSYHLFQQDIELMASLGVNAYRFSISWSRVLPEGAGAANEQGLRYYDQLIDALLAKDIQPVVTLYHWDLPLALERAGGLLSEQFPAAFRSFASLCFQRYGDRVKKWITINEPWSIAYNGYGTGVFAPGRCSDRRRCAEGDSAREPYTVAHRLLQAHTLAAQEYAMHYSHQGGMLGITLNMDWAEPFGPGAEAEAAANRRRQFQLAWFLDPLMTGRYPQVMVEAVGDRLPAFTAEEVRAMQAYPLGFLGLNHYTSKYMLPAEQASNTSSLPPAVVEQMLAQDAANSFGGWAADQQAYESNVDALGQPIGPQTASSWLQTVPWGFYKTIMYVHSRYALEGSRAAVSASSRSGLLIYITENGCDAPDEASKSLPDVLDDPFRVDYLQGYLAALGQAIADGAPVKGYFAWSLLDNFEWADGYSKRFGLHYVDYADPNKRRYAKRSAGWYRDHVAAHGSYPGRPYLIPPMVMPLPQPVLAPSKDPATSSKQRSWMDWLFGN